MDARVLLQTDNLDAVVTQGADKQSFARYIRREMIDAHGMRDRVRLEQEPDHIGVWPDRDARP